LSLLARDKVKPAGVATGGLFFLEIGSGHAEQHQNDDEGDRKAQQIENNRHR
jgi:hypothetical protein